VTDDESRLESDDELACIDCGAICGYFPMVMHGFDRCPECHLKHEREKVMNVFGTVETSTAMLSWDAPSNDDRRDKADA